MNLETSIVLSCTQLRFELTSSWMEEAMRWIVLAAAATLTLLVASSFAPNRTEAMTVTTPTGIHGGN